MESASLLDGRLADDARVGLVRGSAWRLGHHSIWRSVLGCGRGLGIAPDAEPPRPTRGRGHFCAAASGRGRRRCRRGARGTDAVPVAAEAAHVHLDAAPGGQAAALDAELAVDVDRAAGVRGQEGEEGGGEVGIVAGVVVAACALAGAAEEVAGVVAGDRGAAPAAAAVSQ